MALDPGKIHPGASFDFDPDVVSYWSQWLGHPEPRIVIVGQDFGDVGYFKRHRGADELDNKTNNNLHRLLLHAGLTPRQPPQEDRTTPVFLTNAILCLKEPPMNRPIQPRWARSCAVHHLRPLIRKLGPSIVVAMGAHGWQAVRHALGLEDGPRTIGTAAGQVWTADAGTLVFAVGHCGPLGLANRAWPRQLEDWSRIGDALKQVSKQVSGARTDRGLRG